MKRVSQTSVLQYTLLVVVAGFAFMLLAAPGTSDTGIYGMWLHGANSLGLREYYAGWPDYPPGTLTIFYIADWIVPGGTLAAIKATFLVFLYATAAMIGLWQKSVGAATVALAALLVGTMGLGYADILVAPSLVGSLWLLSKARYLSAGTLFAITCAIKWQPLILIPFVVVYVLGRYEGEAGRWKRRLIDLAKLAAPAVAVAVAVLVIFGIPAVRQSFTRAFTAVYFSGNTLNFEWVLTWFALGTDELVRWTYLDEVPSWMPLVGRALMAILLLTVLVLFVLSKRTFDQLLVAAIAGFFVYFAWNINVHENHLFPAALLGLIVMWRYAEYRVQSLIVIAIHNINMIIIYGITGLNNPGVRRIGALDLTVPYSVIVCGASLVVLVTVCRGLISGRVPRTPREVWVSALR